MDISGRSRKVKTRKKHLVNRVVLARAQAMTFMHLLLAEKGA